MPRPAPRTWQDGQCQSPQQSGHRAPVQNIPTVECPRMRAVLEFIVPLGPEDSSEFTLLLSPAVISAAFLS